VTDHLYLFSQGFIDSMLKLSGMIMVFAAFEQCDKACTFIFRRQLSVSSAFLLSFP